MENINNSDLNNKQFKSQIEKYKCLSQYYELVGCVEKNEDGQKICREHFIKIGECVYNGMKKINEYS
jgi:hypothetical protein